MVNYINLTFNSYFYNTFFKLFTPDYVNFFIDSFVVILFCFFFVTIFYFLLVLNYYKFYINEYLLYSNLLDNLTKLTLLTFKRSNLNALTVKTVILKSVFYFFYFVEILLKTALFFLLFYLIWFKPTINFPSSSRFMFLSKIPNYAVRSDFLFSNFEQNSPKQDLVLRSFITKNPNSVVSKPDAKFIKKIASLPDFDDEFVPRPTFDVKNSDNYLFFFRKFGLKNFPYNFKFKKTNYLSSVQQYRAHSEKFRPIIILDKKILYSGRLNPLLYKRYKLTKSNYEAGEFWSSRRPVNKSYGRKVNKFNQFLNLEKIKLYPIFNFTYFSKKKKKYNKKNITATKKKKKLSNFWKSRNLFLKKKSNFDKISKQRDRFSLKFSNRFKFFKFNLKRKSKLNYKVDFLQFSNLKNPTKLFFDKYKNRKLVNLTTNNSLAKLDAIKSLLSNSNLNDRTLVDKFEAMVANNKFVDDRGLKNLTQSQLRQILNKLLLELMLVDDLENVLLVKYLKTFNDINLVRSSELTDAICNNLAATYLNNYSTIVKYKDKSFSKTDNRKYLVDFTKYNNFLKQSNFFKLNDDKLFYKNNNLFYNLKSEVPLKSAAEHLSTLAELPEDEIYDVLSNVKIKNRLTVFDFFKPSKYRNQTAKSLLITIKNKLFNHHTGWDKKSRLVAGKKVLEDVENLSDFYLDLEEDQDEFEVDEPNRNYIEIDPFYDNEDHNYPINLFKKNYKKFSTFFSKKNYDILTDDVSTKRRELLAYFLVNKINYRLRRIAILNTIFTNQFNYSDNTISLVNPEQDEIEDVLSAAVEEPPLSSEEQFDEDEIVTSRESNRLITRDKLAKKIYRAVYRPIYPDLYNNYLSYLELNELNKFYLDSYKLDKFIFDQNSFSILNKVLANDEINKVDLLLNLQRLKPVSEINKYLYFLNLQFAKFNSLDYLDLLKNLVYNKQLTDKPTQLDSDEIFKQIFDENFLFESSLEGDIGLIFDIIDKHDYNLKLLQTKFFNNFFFDQRYNFEKKDYLRSNNPALNYFFLKYNNFVPVFNRLNPKPLNESVDEQPIGYFRKFLDFIQYISPYDQFLFTIGKRLIELPVPINVVDPVNLKGHKMYYEDFLFFNRYNYKIREAVKSMLTEREFLTKKYYYLSTLINKVEKGSSNYPYYFNFFKDFNTRLLDKNYSYVKKNLFKANSRVQLLKQKEQFLLRFITKAIRYGYVADAVMAELKLKKVQLSIKKYNNFLKFYKLYNKVNGLNKFNLVDPFMNTFNNFVNLFELKLNNNLQTKNEFKFKRRYNPFTISNFKVRKKKKFKFIRARKRSFVRRLALFKTLIANQFRFQQKNKIMNKQNILFKYRLNLRKLRQEQRFKRKYFSTFLRIANFNQLPKYNSTGWFILLNNLKDFRRFLMKPFINIKRQYASIALKYGKLLSLKEILNGVTLTEKFKNKKFMKKNKKFIERADKLEKLLLSTDEAKKDRKTRLEFKLLRYYNDFDYKLDLFELLRRNKFKLPFFKQKRRKLAKRKKKRVKRIRKSIKRRVRAKKSLAKFNNLKAKKLKRRINDVINKITFKTSNRLRFVSSPLSFQYKLFLKYISYIDRAKLKAHPLELSYQSRRFFKHFKRNLEFNALTYQKGIFVHYVEKAINKLKILFDNEQISDKRAFLRLLLFWIRKRENFLKNYNQSRASILRLKKKKNYINTKKLHTNLRSRRLVISNEKIKEKYNKYKEKYLDYIKRYKIYRAKKKAKFTGIPYRNLKLANLRINDKKLLNYLNKRIKKRLIRKLRKRRLKKSKRKNLIWFKKRIFKFRRKNLLYNKHLNFDTKSKIDNMSTSQIQDLYIRTRKFPAFVIKNYFVKEVPAEKEVEYSYYLSPNAVSLLGYFFNNNRPFVHYNLIDDELFFNEFVANYILYKNRLFYNNYLEGKDRMQYITFENYPTSPKHKAQFLENFGNNFEQDYYNLRKLNFVNYFLENYEDHIDEIEQKREDSFAKSLRRLTKFNRIKRFGTTRPKSKLIFNYLNNKSFFIKKSLPGFYIGRKMRFGNFKKKSEDAITNYYESKHIQRKKKSYFKLNRIRKLFYRKEFLKRVNASLNKKNKLRFFFTRKQYKQFNRSDFLDINKFTLLYSVKGAAADFIRELMLESSYFQFYKLKNNFSKTGAFSILVKNNLIRKNNNYKKYYFLNDSADNTLEKIKKVFKYDVLKFLKPVEAPTLEAHEKDYIEHHLESILFYNMFKDIPVKNNESIHNAFKKYKKFNLFDDFKNRYKKLLIILNNQKKQQSYFFISKLKQKYYKKQLNLLQSIEKNLYFKPYYHFSTTNDYLSRIGLSLKLKSPIVRYKSLTPNLQILNPTPRFTLTERRTLRNFLSVKKLKYLKKLKADIYTKKRLYFLRKNKNVLDIFNKKKLLVLKSFKKTANLELLLHNNFATNNSIVFTKNLFLKTLLSKKANFGKKFEVFYNYFEPYDLYRARFYLWPNRISKNNANLVIFSQASAEANVKAGLRRFPYYGLEFLKRRYLLKKKKLGMDFSGIDKTHRNLAEIKKIKYFYKKKIEIKKKIKKKIFNNLKLFLKSFNVENYNLLLRFKKLYYFYRLQKIRKGKSFQTFPHLYKDQINYLSKVKKRSRYFFNHYNLTLKSKYSVSQKRFNYYARKLYLLNNYHALTNLVKFRKVFFEKKFFFQNLFRINTSSVTGEFLADSFLYLANYLGANQTIPDRAKAIILKRIRNPALFYLKRLKSKRYFNYTGGVELEQDEAPIGSKFDFYLNNEGPYFNFVKKNNSVIKKKRDILFKKKQYLYKLHKILFDNKSYSPYLKDNVYVKGDQVYHKKFVKIKRGVPAFFYKLGSLDPNDQPVSEDLTALYYSNLANNEQFEKLFKEDNPDPEKFYTSKSTKFISKFFRKQTSYLAFKKNKFKKLLYKKSPSINIKQFNNTIKFKKLKNNFLNRIKYNKYFNYFYHKFKIIKFKKKVKKNVIQKIMNYDKFNGIFKKHKYRFRHVTKRSSLNRAVRLLKIYLKFNLKSNRRARAIVKELKRRLKRLPFLEFNEIDSEIEALKSEIETLSKSINKKFKTEAKQKQNQKRFDKFMASLDKVKKNLIESFDQPQFKKKTYLQSILDKDLSKDLIKPNERPLNNSIGIYDLKKKDFKPKKRKKKFRRIAVVSTGKRYFTHKKKFFKQLTKFRPFYNLNKKRKLFLTKLPTIKFKKNFSIFNRKKIDKKNRIIRKILKQIKFRKKFNLKALKLRKNYHFKNLIFNLASIAKYNLNNYQITTKQKQFNLYNLNNYFLKKKLISKQKVKKNFKIFKKIKDRIELHHHNFKKFKLVRRFEQNKVKPAFNTVGSSILFKFNDIFLKNKKALLYSSYYDLMLKNYYLNNLTVSKFGLITNLKKLKKLKRLKNFSALTTLLNKKNKKRFFLKFSTFKFDTKDYFKKKVHNLKNNLLLKFKVDKIIYETKPNYKIKLYFSTLNRLKKKENRLFFLTSKNDIFKEKISYKKINKKEKKARKLRVKIFNFFFPDEKEPAYQKQLKKERLEREKNNEKIKKEDLLFSVKRLDKMKLEPKPDYDKTSTSLADRITKRFKIDFLKFDIDEFEPNRKKKHEFSDNYEVQKKNESDYYETDDEFEDKILSEPVDRKKKKPLKVTQDMLHRKFPDTADKLFKSKYPKPGVRKPGPPKTDKQKQAQYEFRRDPFRYITRPFRPRRSKKRRKKRILFELFQVDKSLITRFFEKKKLLHSSRNYYSVDLADILYKYYFKKKNNIILILRNTASTYLTNFNYLNLNNFIFKEFPHYKKHSKKKHNYIMSPFGLYFRKINNTKSYFFNYFEKKNKIFEIDNKTNSDYHILFQVILDSDFSNFAPYKGPRFYTAYDYNMYKIKHNVNFLRKLDVNKIFRNEIGFGKEKQHPVQFSVKDNNLLFKNLNFYNLKNNIFNFINYNYEYLVGSNDRTSYLIPFFLKTTTVATYNEENELDDEEDQPYFAFNYVLNYKHYYFKNNFINFVKKLNFRRNKNKSLSKYQEPFLKLFPTKILTTSPVVSNRFKFYSFPEKRILKNSVLKRNVDNFSVNTNNSYKILNLNKFNYYLGTRINSLKPKQLKKRNQTRNWFLNSKLFFNKSLFKKKNRKLVNVIKVNNLSLPTIKSSTINKITKVAKRVKSEFDYLPNQLSKFNDKFGTKLIKFKGIAGDIFDDRPIKLRKIHFNKDLQSNFWMTDVFKYEKLYRTSLQNEYLYIFNSLNQQYKDILFNNFEVLKQTEPFNSSSYYFNSVNRFVSKLGFRRGYDYSARWSMPPFKRRYAYKINDYHKLLNLSYNLVDRFLFEQSDYFNYFRSKISPLKIKKVNYSSKLKRNLLTLNKFKKLMNFNLYLLSKLNLSINTLYSLAFCSLFISIFTTNNKVEDFFPTAFNITYEPKSTYVQDFFKTLQYNKYIGFYFESLLSENDYLTSERVTRYKNTFGKLNNIPIIIFLKSKLETFKVAKFNLIKEVKLFCYSIYLDYNFSNDIKLKVDELKDYTYAQSLQRKKFKKEQKRLKKVLKLQEEFEKEDQFSYYLFKRDK